MWILILSVIEQQRNDKMKGSEQCCQSSIHRFQISTYKGTANYLSFASIFIFRFQSLTAVFHHLFKPYGLVYRIYLPPISFLHGAPPQTRRPFALSVFLPSAIIPGHGRSADADLEGDYSRSSFGWLHSEASFAYAKLEQII